MNNEQRGSATLNIILFLLLTVIATLIYVMLGESTPRAGRTVGTDAHVHTTVRPTAIPGTSYEFRDGLGNASSTTEYPLDEFGAGLARIDVFRHDINNDGRIDIITRRQRENGTAHFTYEYTIELNTEDGMVDITPDGFYTIEGAQCALQKLHFSFTPGFQVIKISRPWEESWENPTVATQDTYSIIKDNIHLIDSRTLRSVCDVSELF